MVTVVGDAPVGDRLLHRRPQQAQRPAAGRYSWGYHRWEVIGALASVALIWVLTAVLCLEAVNRLLRPEPVGLFVKPVTQDSEELYRVA
jgi:hypothetical protein